ncbi:MAG: DUF4855 domain-containing protein [Dysgonamonadaceae bacterium]|jgi:hypothetical protein|nr:DUF4855 domain-containing protein [Dysgonamonadaceae bacterium]
MGFKLKILLCLCLPLLIFCCGGNDKDPVTPEDPETPTITGDYILAAAVLNISPSEISIDNNARMIEVALPRKFQKDSVRIKLTVNKGVTMEYPESEEAVYNLSKENQGVWLKAGNESIKFTMVSTVLTMPESPVGKATIRDLVLIYDSYGTHRPEWNETRFAPYLSLERENGSHDWLFDGFLFIEFTDVNYDFCTGYGHNPARKTEWTKLVQHCLFRENLSAQALDNLIEKIKPKAPAAGLRKVVLTMPEPIKGQSDWGEVDGKTLSFLNDDDRITAAKWYIDYAISEYKAASFNNIQLAGFYWVSEAVGNSRTIVKTVADYIHSKGLNFYWIPYFNADGYSQWADFGFDEAWLQPNYFFDTSVPLSRLDEACALANKYNMSNEFEFDANALWGGAKRQRMLDYIDAFKRNNVFRDKNISYYEGGDGLYRLFHGTSEDLELYRLFTEIIAERQIRLKD